MNDLKTPPRTGQTDHIVPAQVVKVTERVITLKTQNNQVIKIKHKKDKLLTQTMLDLLRTKLWIPVNLTLHKLLKYDWIQTPSLQYS
ncbi:hypothetical protein SAMN05216431_101173 [Ligilactobacillus sp. WC1T17]|uniref:Uncharacterized protein n=1 Tax=Ligilactobacillus ruminis TaxID=1623 RepID=A0ABY1A981_9LACO|nr:hypothetical protein SAMN05216431_101173 [Ligilactobacillus ruminis]